MKNTLLEERVDALEDFLFATSPVNTLADAARRIAKRLDTWNHPPAAVKDFDGMYQDLEEEPYCDDKASIDAYVKNLYGLNQWDKIPPLEERKKIRKETPHPDELFDIAQNRINIYVQMIQKIWVIEWLEEVNKTFHYGFNAEIGVIQATLKGFTVAAKKLIEVYPRQELITAISGTLNL